MELTGSSSRLNTTGVAFGSQQRLRASLPCCARKRVAANATMHGALLKSRFGCTPQRRRCEMKLVPVQQAGSYSIPTTPDRELLPVQQAGSYSRKLLPVQQAGSYPTTPESYSRCNKPGATPES